MNNKLTESFLIHIRECYELVSRLTAATEDAHVNVCMLKIIYLSNFPLGFIKIFEH